MRLPDLAPAKHGRNGDGIDHRSAPGTPGWSARLAAEAGWRLPASDAGDRKGGLPGPSKCRITTIQRLGATGSSAKAAGFVVNGSVKVPSGNLTVHGVPIRWHLSQRAGYRIPWLFANRMHDGTKTR